jgi:nicotinamide mononucleotide (NMN) deamidase PncC
MAAVFASKTRATLAADWAIAELGAAGPKGTPYGHDAGTAVIAVSGARERSSLFTTGVRDRQANMWSFATAALELLGDALDDTPVP